MHLLLFIWQKSLSSLELPGALSIANGASLQHLSNSVSSLDSRRPDGVSYEGSSSTSEYTGRNKHKVHDPARDVSIQVLEKFSLLTKFARETTSHIFRESQNNGFGAYERKQKKDSFQVNESVGLPNDTETASDTLEKPDPLEVKGSPYTHFNSYALFAAVPMMFNRISVMQLLFSCLETFLIPVMLKVVTCFF